MPATISLWDLVDSIGANYGTDWKNVAPDEHHKSLQAYKFSAECWLHVLNGLTNGHLVAFIDTQSSNTLVVPSAWPDLTGLSDTKPETFQSLSTGIQLQFTFTKSIATFVDSRKGTVSGNLLVDEHSADWFKVLFKDDKYVESQSGKWKQLGTLGEMPALLLGDLLEAWKNSNSIEKLPMRRSILRILKQSEQSTSSKHLWNTPHAVFDCEGNLIAPSHVKQMEKWLSASDDKDAFERHWSDQLVVGRDWFRQFCQEDPGNRPLPAFWEGPTPQPSILLEIKNRPSPLKGRRNDLKQAQKDEWLQAARDLRKRYPDWTKSDICRQVAKDCGPPRKMGLNSPRSEPNGPNLGQESWAELVTAIDLPS